MLPNVAALRAALLKRRNYQREALMICFASLREEQCGALILAWLLGFASQLRNFANVSAERLHLLWFAFRFVFRLDVFWLGDSEH